MAAELDPARLGPEGIEAAQLDAADLDSASAVFGALSDPRRRALLAEIAQHPSATATELAADLPISRQAVLKHLNALAAAGLLGRERSGREVRYRVTPAPLSDAVSWMAAVGSQWDDRLAMLARQVGGPATASGLDG